MPSKYPDIEDTARPYRLWDEDKRKYVPYRNYLHWQNAHWGAIKELRFSDIYTHLVVMNCVTKRVLCYYNKTLHSIDWEPPNHAKYAVDTSEAKEIHANNKTKAANAEVFERRAINNKRLASTRGYTRASDKKNAKKENRTSIN